MPSRHPLAALDFPDRRAGFMLSECETSDLHGHDVRARYEPEDGMPLEVSVSVYPVVTEFDPHFASCVASLLKSHGRTAMVKSEPRRIGGCFGRWVVYRATEKSDGTERPVMTALWLFEVDGWFVKWRATWLPDLPIDALVDAVEPLIGAVGWPDTRRQLQRGLERAVARSRAAMRALESWIPSAAGSDSILREALEARAVGDLTGACRCLQHAGGESCPGRHAELGRLHLLAGDLTDAAEACIAEEELASGESARLEEALKSYIADSVSYDGGWGTSRQAAVDVSGIDTLSQAVNAHHRYLEFMLGERGRDWKLGGVTVCSTVDTVLAEAHVLLTDGRHLTIFFALPAPDDAWAGLPVNETLGTFLTAQTVDGSEPEPDPIADDQPEPGAQLWLNPRLNLLSHSAIEYTLAALTHHSTQTLILAPQEMS